MVETISTQAKGDKMTTTHYSSVIIKAPENLYELFYMYIVAGISQYTCKPTQQ
uniref:Uncharacterized protein n=1 Tax=Rhizophora mucronata TaxID=61149 RepID=A0A2P2NFT9_RHIMU